MKVPALPATTHNPCDESHWASCLRENLTSSSYGEGLETDGFDLGTAPVPYPTLEAMITWLTEELNSQRWRRGVSKGGWMRVGLSGFIFEESLSRDVSIGPDKTNVRTK